MSSNHAAPFARKPGDNIILGEASNLSALRRHSSVNTASDLAGRPSIPGLPSVGNYEQPVDLPIPPRAKSAPGRLKNPTSTVSQSLESPGTDNYGNQIYERSLSNRDKLNHDNAIGTNISRGNDPIPNGHVTFAIDDDQASHHSPSAQTANHSPSNDQCRFTPQRQRYATEFALLADLNLADYLHRVPNASYFPSLLRTKDHNPNPIIKAEILRWSVDRKWPWIYWLSAPAEHRRTSITATVADVLDHTKTLAASFFFTSKSGGRSDITRLITTLAYDIAITVPSMRQAIVDVLRKNPTIGSRSFSQQFLDLLVRPIYSHSSADLPPFVVIIDSIDQCEDKDLVNKFLEALLYTSSQNYLAFKILLTGQMDDRISEQLQPAVRNRIIYLWKIENAESNSSCECQVPPAGQESRNLVVCLDGTSNQYNEKVIIFK